MSVIKKYIDGSWVPVVVGQKGDKGDTGDTGATGATGPIGPKMVFLVGERNGTPTVGQRYAYGNGGSDQSVAMPYSGTATAMSLVGDSSHSGTTTAQVQLNGVDQGASYEVSCTNSASAYTVFGTPLSFSAGDTISASVTAVPSGGGGSAAGIVIIFD